MKTSIRSNTSRALQASAALLLCLLLAGCGGTPLYSDLDEQQANEVMAALLDAGIDASKAPSPSKKGWEVDIARRDIPAAMGVLQAAGLPQRQSASMGELFKKDSFATSATQQKALYAYGLEEGIRNKLLKIPGVVDAEVSIAMPDKNALTGEGGDTSASVMIFERPGANLSNRETDLKVFIKDGIAGLEDRDKVTIKFFPATGARAAKPQAGKTPAAALSDIDPVTVAAVLGIAALLALLLALGNRLGIGDRLRGRMARDKSPSPTWKG